MNGVTFRKILRRLRVQALRVVVTAIVATVTWYGQKSIVEKLDTLQNRPAAIVVCELKADLWAMDDGRLDCREVRK